MNDPADGFAPTYAAARAKFLSAAAQAGLSVQSHLLDLPGREGEQLAMDVARDGPADAAKLLVLTSGNHGVEGFCGSGIQVALLGDDAWRAQAREAGVAVLHVHALNPYGFSHLRRVTQENVDLNRNFHDFAGPLPRNEAYASIHDLLLPGQWPPGDDNAAAVMRYIATHGEAAWQAAVSAGQYGFPDGLFFGGTSPTWSNRTFREVLRTHGRQASDIAWIDLHTGLGPSGHGERIWAGRDEAQGIARARRWWGEQVTSIYDGSSTSALLNGLAFSAVYEECPQARYTGIALEYGTLPIMQVLQALRAEHWLRNHPEAPGDQAKRIKRQIRDAFYTDTPEWKRQVVAQAREAVAQAVEGLR